MGNPRYNSKYNLYTNNLMNTNLIGDKLKINEMPRQSPGQAEPFGAKSRQLISSVDRRVPMTTDKDLIRNPDIE